MEDKIVSPAFKTLAKWCAVLGMIVVIYPMVFLIPGAGDPYEAMSDAAIMTAHTHLAGNTLLFFVLTNKLFAESSLALDRLTVSRSGCLLLRLEETGKHTNQALDLFVETGSIIIIIIVLPGMLIAIAIAIARIIILGIQYGRRLIGFVGRHQRRALQGEEQKDHNAQKNQFKAHGAHSLNFITKIFYNL